MGVGPISRRKACSNRQQGRDLAANQNQELKALVEKVAPAFEAHRKMAEELGKKVASK